MEGDPSDRHFPAPGHSSLKTPSIMSSSTDRERTISVREIDNLNGTDTDTIKDPEKQGNIAPIVPEGCILQKDGRVLVGFSAKDKDFPYNWTKTKRWIITGWAGFTLFNSTLASSAPSGSSADYMKEFGVSEIAASLVLSLFLCGYVVGPFVMSPLAERFGRRFVLVYGSWLYVIFSAACAGAPNFGGLLAFRFLAGTFASGPLTNAGSCMGDIWEPAYRGEPLSVFTLAPFAGPSIGPLIGGFISENDSMSWRWLFGILTIIAGVLAIVSLFAFPETYPPYLLVMKAKKLRKEYKTDIYFAPLEEEGKSSSTIDQASIIFARPFKMLFTEKIVYLTTLYLSVAYGIMYLLFEAYPIVYSQIRGFSPGTSGLAFLSIMIGAVISCFICLAYQGQYLRDVEKRQGQYVPELRLKQGFFGGPLITISLFWLGWTGYDKNIHWAAPMSSGIFMGMGSVLLFRAFQTYMIDAYGQYSASCLAATVVCRSIAGAAFPLFAHAMYKDLGVQWASTLLACLMLIMCPIPFLFYRYGEQIRSRSKYAPSGK